MKAPFLIFSALLLTLISCGETNYKVSKIEGKQIAIKDSILANDSILDFIAPYKERLAQEMDSVLAYAPNNLSETNRDLNIALGNMMADAVMELSNPVFKARTGNNLDMVLLNHGGIRSSINKGAVTTKTAYQLMPFENEVVVAHLKGEQIKEIVRYLIEGQTAHPIAGMELALDANNEIQKALVQGKPIQDDKIYYVATNDYLYEGGDNMNFFSKSQEVTALDYKIRNILIDYFKLKDTIAPVVDQRFIRN
ncbi:5'-nucleotidase C-terminal domain-containing protein [Salinimicrobium sp. GXAS 041]|uniref:5'-nucleotidase C-terminal domain-containing protein n=1 Tax=Salinimicrobium sp. GXAS 041 TaxID=3400806 RepID=UPI003C7243BD